MILNPQAVVELARSGNVSGHRHPFRHRATEDPTKAAATGTGGAVVTTGAAPPWSQPKYIMEVTWRYHVKIVEIPSEFFRGW